MAHFLRPRLLSFLSVGAGLLLAGCCANNVCECEDGQDAIRFQFSADTTGAGKGFRRADLDTLIVQRFPLPYDTLKRFETVALFRTGATAKDSTLALDNNTPFAQTGTTGLSRYRYVLRYLAHPNGPMGMPIRRGVPTTVLTIDSVQIKGDYESTGCCACYENTKKVLFRDSSRTPISLARSEVVVLTKK